MRTKRTELADDIIRQARAFRDACDDGLGLAANTDAYLCWVELSKALDEYDGLEPGSIEVTSHTANAAGPDTQHAAAELIRPAQHSLRQRMLSNYRIRAGFNDGCTDSEMEYITKRAHTSVSSARNFLANTGWIADSGRRRLTPSGREAIVWVLTRAGMTAYDQGALT